MNLLPMDYALLRHLVEFDGAVPAISIPTKLFTGDIPDDAPNLVESGMIEHIGDVVSITSAGRLALLRAPDIKGDTTIPPPPY